VGKDYFNNSTQRLAFKNTAGNCIMRMFLFETSLDARKMKNNHPHTYKQIQGLDASDFMGCWVSMRGGEDPQEWVALLRFYRNGSLGGGGYCAHGYLWCRCQPASDLYRAWGFSVRPRFEFKRLKNAPGHGLEWQLRGSADTLDELLTGIGGKISLAKMAVSREFSVLKDTARRHQMLEPGLN